MNEQYDTKFIKLWNSVCKYIFKYCKAEKDRYV